MRRAVKGRRREREGELAEVVDVNVWKKVSQGWLIGGLIADARFCGSCSACTLKHHHPTRRFRASRAFPHSSSSPLRRPEQPLPHSARPLYLRHLSILLRRSGSEAATTTPPWASP